MTILSVIRDVSLKIGVSPRPDALFAGTSRTLQELQSLANETAQMIAFDVGHDWTALKTLATLAGDGVKLNFAFPAGYRKMLKKARLWSSASPYSPFTHYVDSDQWLGTQVQSFQAVTGAWTIIGDEILVRSGGATSPLGPSESLQFYFITKNIVRDAGGTAKPEFTSDTDEFRLDERLLKLGLIYKWKEAKNQDYAEDMSNYENALFERIGTDKGSNIIIVGGTRMTAEEYAFPLSIVP